MEEYMIFVGLESLECDVPEEIVRSGGGSPAKPKVLSLGDIIKSPLTEQSILCIAKQVIEELRHDNPKLNTNLMYITCHDTEAISENNIALLAKKLQERVYHGGKARYITGRGYFCLILGIGESTILPEAKIVNVEGTPIPPGSLYGLLSRVGPE